VHARFYGELLRYFTREVKDAHEAQDLVQEAHGRVLARVAAGEKIEDLRGLLYETARNLLIDRHRQMLVRRHVSDAVLADMRGPACHEPETRYAGRQRVRLLEQTIESLPLRCRQAFVLHKLDGLPQAEVAARMGVSINMVERHIMLAVATCRKALGEDRSRRRPALASSPATADERDTK
jgi:RNA polymerase sigma-70 factor (ECF subfamily)